MNRNRPVAGSLVLLDANVLYPISICDFILTASSHQLLARPVVSAEILDEATRNITADRPDLEPARIERRFNAVRAATDGHDQPVTRRFADTSIINTKDRHVLAAALHHDVDYIVTNDARLRAEIIAWLDHRPRRHKLIAAISPDQLTAALIGESPDEVVAVVTAMATRLRNPTRTVREVVAALSNNLPAIAAINLAL
jgi:predicted nucleic acid-binding protein